MALTLAFACLISSNVRGNPILLIPNGNPTGAATAKSPPINGVTYTVVAQQALTTLPFPEDVTIASILAGQGFDAANGWTVSYFSLQGSYRLDTLEAVAGPLSGGVDFRVSYLPQGTDPAGSGVARWVQFIATNLPTSGAINPYQSVDGLTYYIDNVGNPQSDPFYDPIGDADHAYLGDGPRRSYSNNSVWRAYTFIATGNLANKQLALANVGVYWGFDDPVTISTPEPGSVVLFFTVASLVFVRSKVAKLRRDSMDR